MGPAWSGNWKLEIRNWSCEIGNEKSEIRGSAMGYLAALKGRNRSARGGAAQPRSPGNPDPNWSLEIRNWKLEIGH